MHLCWVILILLSSVDSSNRNEIKMGGGAGMSMNIDDFLLVFGYININKYGRDYICDSTYQNVLPVVRTLNFNFELHGEKSKYLKIWS